MNKVVLGGPMMGQCAFDLQTPVTKGVSGILLFRDDEQEKPLGNCVRCGGCVNVCPVGLMPLTLYALSRKGMYERARDAQHLMDCIECGACAYQCPARLPLVQHIRAAKGALRARAGPRIAIQTISQEGKVRMEDMALKRASSSPHIHAGRTVQGLMLEVIVALVPAGAFGIWYFGWRALLIIAVSVAVGRLLGVAVRRAWRKSPARWAISSAVVTGVLLAYNLPVERACVDAGDRHAAGHRAGENDLWRAGARISSTRR